MPNLDRSVRNLLSALVLPALLASGACGGGSSPGTGAAGSSAGGTATGGTSNPGTGGSSTGGSATGGDVGTGGSTGAGGTAPIAVCTSYCTTIMAACTGQNQQYANMDNCMKTCAYMTAGSPTDDGVNTADCRINQAKLAAMDTAAIKSKCWSAGPLTYGACGDNDELFCAVAMNYCAGKVDYKSLADCLTTAASLNQVVNFGDPGTYNATYTPGPDVTSKDTLECRGFYLFIDALQSTANQTADCPNVSNVSPACGMGYVPPVIDTDGGSDGPVAVYDGPKGNIINISNWNDTIYPPAKRKMLLRDEGDPHLAMVDLSKPMGSEVVWKTVAEGPWARAAQLIGGNQILGGTSTGYQVFDYTTGAITKTVKGFGNTQSAYRMATGETMLTQSGTILTFLDKNDVKSHQISYPGHGYVRVARPTRNGTFLVPADTDVFEGDANGHELWSLNNGASGWGHIWEPLLLGPAPPGVTGAKWNDGDTLLCTAFGSSCDVIDKVKHTVSYRFGGKAMPMAATFKPNFFSEFEILPDGHIFTANWQGHGGGNGGSGIQVIEFDQTGTVVWYWKQDPAAFSSIQGVQVMDGKNPMYLHVQETSTDSTWQPIMP
jgi:hypothetical protein